MHPLRIVTRVGIQLGRQRRLAEFGHQLLCLALVIPSVPSPAPDSNGSKLPQSTMVETFTHFRRVRPLRL